MVVQLTEGRIGCKRYDGGYNAYWSINLANFFFAHTKGEQGSCTCPSAVGSDLQKIHSWNETNITESMYLFDPTMYLPKKAHKLVIQGKIK